VKRELLMRVKRQLFGLDGNGKLIAPKGRLRQRQTVVLLKSIEMYCPPDLWLVAKSRPNGNRAAYQKPQ